MDEVSKKVKSENHISQDASSESQQKLAKPSSKFKKKTFFILIFIVFALVSWIAYINLFKYKNIDKISINSNNIAVNSNTSSDLINWEATPTQINPTGPLKLISPTKLPKDPNSTSPNFTYYKVGTWGSGPYKGNELVDIVVTRIDTYSGVSDKPINSVDALFRVTPSNGKLIFFKNSSIDSIDQINVGTTAIEDALFKDPQIVVDTRLLPDLFYSSPSRINKTNYVKITNQDISVNGVNITLQFNDKNEVFANDVKYFAKENLTGYKYLATFASGQKLYARVQGDGKTIPWSSLNGIPYVVEDVDHTILPVFGEQGQIENISQSDISNMQWSVKPLTPPLLYSRDSNLDTIDLKTGYAYSSSTCEYPSVTQIGSSSGFNTTDLKQVMTYKDQSYYILSGNDNLYNSLYSQFILHPVTQSTSSSTTISQSDFIKTYPLLISKDQLGIYKIYFRFLYPGQTIGCG